MKFSIDKIKFLITCMGLVLLLSACGNSKKEQPKEVTASEATEKKVEENHTEEPATIASITPEQIKSIGIELGKIENKQLTATLKVNGTLKVPNNNKANATSLYGGVIKDLPVLAGTYVKKGQLIATISNPQYIQLQEEYLSLESKIIFSGQELQRQKDLNAGNAGALKNLQSAEADLKALQTRRSALSEQIRLMGINPQTVSNTNLRSTLAVTSPISGTISNVIAKIGSYVDVASPVVEIVDNSQLHLDIQVFEKDLPLMKVGQTIHFTLTNYPTNEYDAQIFSIGSAFENESKTIPVHCTVKGNKTGLIDGMNITAIVSLNNLTSSAVPNNAIVSADGKDYIFIVTDKKPEEHHEEGEKGHNEEKQEKESDGHTEKEHRVTNFEKIEIIKGVSNMGYTAVTFINPVPKDAQIAVKGAFFINAKLSNTGGHSH